MDSALRTFAKSLTWQGMGLISMTLVGFLFTGSVSAGGGIAAVGAVVGFVSYFLHEALWGRVSWGRVGRGQLRTPHEGQGPAGLSPSR